MNKSIEEAITDFYHFIEDCIKNGDPKYQTGGSEISVKDWKRLMEYIDDTMEQVREEQRLDCLLYTSRNFGLRRPLMKSA